MLRKRLKGVVATALTRAIFAVFSSGGVWIDPSPQGIYAECLFHEKREVRE